MRAMNVCLYAVVISAASIMFGCDATEVAPDGFDDAVETPLILQSLRDDLSLSDAQVDALRSVSSVSDDGQPDPAHMWRLAAALQRELTATQIDDLVDRAHATHRRVRERALENQHPVTRRFLAPPGERQPALSEEARARRLEALEQHREEVMALREQVHDGLLTREQARDKLAAMWLAMRTDAPNALRSPVGENGKETRRLDERFWNRDSRDGMAQKRREAAEVRDEILGLTSEQKDAMRSARKHGNRADALSSDQKELIQLYRSLKRQAVFRRLDASSDDS